MRAFQLSHWDAFFPSPTQRLHSFMERATDRPAGNFPSKECKTRAGHEGDRPRDFSRDIPRIAHREFPVKNTC